MLPLPLCLALAMPQLPHTCQRLLPDRTSHSVTQPFSVPVATSAASGLTAMAQTPASWSGSSATGDGCVLSQGALPSPNLPMWCKSSRCNSVSDPKTDEHEPDDDGNSARRQGLMTIPD